MSGRARAVSSAGLREAGALLGRPGTRPRVAGGLGSLTGRGRQVLSLMAGGRSSAAIAAGLVVSPGPAEKHMAGVFAQLGLPPSDNDNRRVLAVLRSLGA